MTWQGGKRARDQKPSPFARLKPLGKLEDDVATSLDCLAKALSGYGKSVRLHIRLVNGAEGTTVEHWEVVGGSKSAKVKKNAKAKDADVVVVMRQETWAQIAQGMLA